MLIDNGFYQTLPQRLPIKIWLHFAPVERQLLFNRGITDPESAEKFLNAQNEVHDPYLLKDMDKAVERICQAIAENHQIVIFGDYDVDGVTATALLVEVFNQLGGKADPLHTGQV